MQKIVSILSITYCLSGSLVMANESTNSPTTGPFTKQKAEMCIQLNKDMNLASQQMLQTESDKAHLKSKIVYLQGAIKERRDLIEDLDQRNYQENNDNYNQLVDQYEGLVEEKSETIELFNNKQQLHVSQHNSVVRLEQRFSAQCLEEVEITQQLYSEVCKLEEVRWCSAFSFN